MSYPIKNFIKNVKKFKPWTSRKPTGGKSELKKDIYNLLSHISGKFFILNNIFQYSTILFSF